MGRSADLPIQDHFWRHVRQKCIFREGTLAFPKKNEYMPVRKFVSQGANFRVSPLVEKPGFFNELDAMPVKGHGVLYKYLRFFTF